MRYRKSYALKGREVLEFDDVMKWAEYMTEHGENCRVAHDTIDECDVSTVLLWCDHSHSFSDGPPLIFETMVFAPWGNMVMDRYCTYDEAEAAHNVICASMRHLHEASIELSRSMLHIVSGGVQRKGAKDD